MERSYLLDLAPDLDKRGAQPSAEDMKLYDAIHRNLAKLVDGAHCGDDPEKIAKAASRHPPRTMVAIKVAHDGLSEVIPGLCPGRHASRADAKVADANAKAEALRKVYANPHLVGEDIDVAGVIPNAHGNPELAKKKALREPKFFNPYRRG
jgi:hypothetical protein